MGFRYLYLNIGSNSGDRRALIGRAVAAVVMALGPARMSRPFRSAPGGFSSSSEFLNIGLEIDISDTSFSAMDVCGACRAILACLKKIEKDISDMPHRNPDGSYRDREIDIDMIALDGCVVDSPDIIVPHPRMDIREFVLVPMAGLAPGWMHPVSGLTPVQMLEKLQKRDLSTSSDCRESSPGAMCIE